MVYFLNADPGELYSHGVKPLDGDIDKVKPLDLTPDGGVEVEPLPVSFGRPLDPQHVPTRAKIDGPRRKLTDLRTGLGLLVDVKFKAEVEALEPGVHQFFPIELVWKDGSHAADRFWFVPCNRLDSVDRAKTTKEFRSFWLFGSDRSKKLVFNRSQIGSHHAWIDKFILPTGGVWISNLLKQRLESAGVTGMYLVPYDEVD